MPHQFHQDLEKDEPRYVAIKGCGLADLYGIIHESYSAGSVITLTIRVCGRTLVTPLKMVLKDSTSP